MSKSFVRLLLVLVLVSVACSAPFSSKGGDSPLPQIISQFIVTADPHGTATPTPFQPVGPTSTPRPNNTPDPQDAIEPGLDIPGLPSPERINKPMPKGVVNLLVLGSDYRPGSGFRTDVIQLVTINTQKGTVSIVSFPRDLYVTIPGWVTQRINTAFPHGGFQMMVDTFDYNFGIKPTFYVMTNFQGFSGIIDSLGGVNVNVGQYLSDTCDLPQSSGGWCTVNPGTVYMDGQTALWYVRSRHSTSDFDRGRRQREVLAAVFERMMSMDAINRLPELYTAYQNSVETNMSLSDLARLLPVASQVLSDSSRVRQYSVGPDQVTPYTTEEGAMVLLPNYGAIQQVLLEAVFGE